MIIFKTVMETSNNVVKHTNRDIIIVANDMYKLIPDDETELREAFENILLSFKFMAPEIRRYGNSNHWNKLTQVLLHHIPQEKLATLDWCQKMKNIFSDPNYKINEEY